MLPIHYNLIYIIEKREMKKKKRVRIEKRAENFIFFKNIYGVSNGNLSLVLDNYKINTMQFN